MFQHRKLKYDLYLTFIFIQLITVSSIIYYNINSSEKMASRYSGELMDHMGKNMINLIDNNFKELSNFIYFASYAIKNIDEVNINNKQLTRYLINGLKKIPFCMNVYIATDTGKFFYIGRRDKFLPGEQSSKGYAYSADVITNNTDGSSIQEEYFFNDQGDVVVSDKSHFSSVVYDPTKRNWYQRATEEMQGVWIDAYPFRVGQGDYHVGITYAEPLMLNGNKPQGAVAADVLLKHIESVMANDSINAKQIIFNTKGQILASNLGIPSVTVESNSLHFESMDKLNSITEKAFKIYEATQISRTLVEDEYGDNYIVDVNKFPDQYFGDWLSLTYLPLNAFMTDVNQQQKLTLMICSIILLLSIIIISLFARRIVQPILKLGQQANAIRDFDLSPKDTITSDITELVEMQTDINNMRTSLQVFAHYVPKDLVKKLIDKGKAVHIGGHSKCLSILFCDIISFTTATEKSPPEQTVKQLCDFYQGLTDVMTANEGCIDKFIGDAIMAFWNAPGNDRNHALHASVSALLCHKKLSVMNREWQFEKKPPFEACFGVHTGDVILGNMGSTDRINYTIIGDAVNLCSRIQDLGRFYGVKVLISEDTFLAIREKAIVRPIDIVVVKGRTQNITIYELVALKDMHPSILPTDDDIASCSAYHAAFSLYLKQNWAAAKNAFTNFIQKYGEDVSANIMLERITQFEQNPPPPNWDGAFHPKSKEA